MGVKKLFQIGLCFGVLAGVSVLLSEKNPKLKYNIRDEKYACIKDEIFDRGADLDVAFFGSSRIWTAVDTPYLEERFEGIQAYNFGTNWFGTNLAKVLVRDALERRHVSNVVIAISQQAQAERHHYFRFLASLADAVEDTRNGFSRLGTKDYLGLSLALRQELSATHDLFFPFAVKGIYGLLREADPTPCNQYPRGYLALNRQHDAVPEKPTTAGYTAPSATLRSLAQLVHSHEARLYFLFVPEKGESAPPAEYLNALSKIGEPLVLESEWMKDPAVWADSGHLNRQGSRQFTELLAESPIFQPSRLRSLTQK